MEEKKQEIYKEFQTILRKNPMLLVGTGVSVAVHEKLGMNVNKTSHTPPLVTYKTDAAKCHISHVVADTDSWEQKTAHILESLDEIKHYVKNHNLGFTIPYTINGTEKNYYPDFIAHVDDGGPDLLNLIIEVQGRRKRTRRSRWKQPGTSGYRPSTTTAASAAGPLSKSPTPGTRTIKSVPF